MKNIICHASGDRCLGCKHYHGKADRCEFARDEQDAEMAARKNTEVEPRTAAGSLD